MLIADHPDPRSDAGFVRAYDAQAARRQFQISIVLVAVLVIAAIALGTLARIRPSRRQRADCQRDSRSAAIFAETLLDIRG